MVHGRVTKKSIENKPQARSKMRRLKLRCLEDEENDLQDQKRRNRGKR
jgi:hypothetical protein